MLGHCLQAGSYVGSVVANSCEYELTNNSTQSFPSQECVLPLFSATSSLTSLRVSAYLRRPIVGPRLHSERSTAFICQSQDSRNEAIHWYLEISPPSETRRCFPSPSVSIMPKAGSDMALQFSSDARTLEHIVRRKSNTVTCLI